MRIQFVISVLFMFGFSSAAVALSSDELCGDSGVKFVPLTVDVSKVIHADVPKSIFGFDLPWYDFQLGHFRNGQVRNKTVEWLKYFPGAAYRFPGGNTYEWERGVGPINKRKKISANYTATGYEKPYFGLAEFSTFLNRVDGKAVITFSLLNPDRTAVTRQKMIASNLGMVQWFNNISSLKCVSGDECRILYWELGNELDWPGTNWTAEEYIEHVNPLIDELIKLYPDIRLLSLGKTAPWDTPSLSNSFNQQLANSLGGRVAGVTIHPYYDGHAIPIMLDWMKKTIKPYKEINPMAKLAVTEHGRWPNQKSARWEDDWYKASGAGGAISSADFIISSMQLPEVDVATWHALGVKGPWQLFHYDSKNDDVYPSAVYWAFRVVRDAMLKDIVSITPHTSKGGNYVGGYDLNLVAMKDDNGALSVIGVNRSSVPVQVSFDVIGQQVGQNTPGGLRYSYLQSDKVGSDNTDVNKQAVTMRTKLLSVNGKLPAGLCIPPMSVFSLYK